MRLPLFLVWRDLPLVIRSLELQTFDMAETVWALQHAAYRHEALRIGETALPPLMDTVEALQRCGETFFGYFGADGDLCGAVSVKASVEGSAEICRLMVAPERFRQGIGSALLQYLFTKALPERTWHVTTEIRNLPAIGLYARHGFVPADRWRPTPALTLVRFIRPRAGE